MTALNITRIARDLVYDTILESLADEIGLPSGSILFDTPPPIYINTRTATSGNLEASRYPILSINPLKNKIVDSGNNYIDLQQESLTATGLVRIFKSTGLMETIAEFCLHTATK